MDRVADEISGTSNIYQVPFPKRWTMSVTGWAYAAIEFVFAPICHVRQAELGNGGQC